MSQEGEFTALARDTMLRSAEVKRRFAEAAAPEVAAAARVIADAVRAGHKVLLCGNGGSAADAQHIAGELVGRFKLERNAMHAVALTTDTSILTSIANDYGFDEIFARQVGGLGSEGDVLMAYSTSGNSRNVVKAIEVARDLGMRSIGLTGATGGAMADLCDICLRVPDRDTPTIQECHATAGHTICLLVEGLLFGEIEEPPVRETDEAEEAIVPAPSRVEPKPCPARVEAERIVVRAPNWVGDVVMATPAFRALRENYPDAHIALALRPSVAPILNGAPWFDEVIAQEDRGMANFMRTIGRLRNGGFDLAVILPNSYRTALEATLGGVARRVGYDRHSRRHLLTDPVPAPAGPDGRFQPINMVDYYLALCRHLGCTGLSQHEELFIEPECQHRADALLDKYGVAADTVLIGLNPGGAYGPSKIWPSDRFAAVADALAERPKHHIILLGSPDERPILEAVAGHMSREPILPAPGETDLDVLKPLVRRCSLLVTNDTGARHVAVAFGVPVVTIMGSTSPRYTDVNMDRQLVVRVDVDCGPCQKKVCATDHRCMTRIPPAMVLAAADKLLAGRPHD